MNKLTVALCVGLALPSTGCGLFFGLGGGGGGAKMPVVEQLDDGSRRVAIDKLGLQMDAPSDIVLRLDTETEDSVVMYWRGHGGRVNQLQVDTKARFMHDDLDSMKNEYRTERTAFSVGEGEDLENGFDLYYSYWSNGKRLGYQAELNVGDSKYRCYIYAGATMPAVKVARQMCRSLSQLERKPEGEAQRATARK